ncbi:MAG: hypothetical protein IJF84_14900 [Thermoguttaceae bacterium]|nr:hypothetical protein [Thermoguttaceae bacterium]
MIIKIDKFKINIENIASAQTETTVSESTEQTSLDPNALFRRARLVYNEQLVVAASMRAETKVHDRHFIGSGDYLEKIENSKRYLRMRMNYSSGNVKYGVQYIADGAHDKFWISKNGAQNELYRVDGYQINAQDANPEMVTSIDGVPVMPASLAGIPYILFQIEKYFDFLSCSLIRERQTNEQYYVITGTWKPERFPVQDYVSDNLIKWDSVSQEIPDTIKIYFGVNDLFPYRINYYRNVKGDPTLISKLNFYDVSFDVRINAKLFNFSPSGNVSSVDITNNYLTLEAIQRQNENWENQQNNPQDFY